MMAADNTIITVISSCIEGSNAKAATKLIAIDGRGGSGKSTLAHLLRDANPAYNVVHLDSFPYRASEQPFHPLGTQTGINIQRILAEAIFPLQRGELARYAQTPWWLAHADKPETIQEVSPGGVVIFEGCYALSPELREHYDLTVWIDRDPSEALADALARDGGEKDRLYWEQVYEPNELRYIESKRPIECADIVIVNRNRVFTIKRMQKNRHL